MTTKERLAWAKVAEASLPVLSTEFSHVVELPGKLPSKANLHEIHFDPSLWRELEPVISQWRKRHPGKAPYWVAPNHTVISYEDEAAYLIRAKMAGRFQGNLGLAVDLHGQGVDVDAVKSIPDAIQKAGVVRNDNQFVRLTVNKYPADEPRVFLQIRRL